MARQIRILHGADFHLGSPFSGLSSDKAAIRRNEQFATLQAVISLCKEHQVQLLLLAGDILDQSRLDLPRQREMMELLAEIPETYIFIAPGNHDPYTKDSPYCQLSWPGHVHIFGAEFSGIYLPEHQAVVWGIGFSAPRSGRSLLPSEFQIQEQAFRNQIIGLSNPEELPEDTIHIGVVHGDVKAHEGERSSYNPIPWSWIGNSGLDYLALGHVHEASGLRQIRQTYFAYPGCPEGRGFDEVGVKGVYIGELAKARASLDFVPVGRRSYFRQTISVEGCSTQREIIQRVQQHLVGEFGSDWERHIYRITLIGALPGDFVPNLSAIKEQLQNDFFVVRMEDKTRPLLNWDEIAKESSLRGVFARKFQQRLEAANLAQDTEAVRLLEAAFTIGLRAFENEVSFHDN